ncbi:MULTISPECIES: SLC13 family permease [unclassified Arthrobacter]|uniref:SLC13 family permease n=1 Tax=unclassified Arthrobacter TaxID=235627 RepID=UPI002157B5F9|nr:MULTISPECIES: SLC13 family permease [unclassified Arthrobacter]
MSRTRLEPANCGTPHRWDQQMGIEAYITFAVIIGVLAALAWGRLPADVVLMGAVLILLLSGVLEPAEALVGFANPGVITVAVLYIVAAGLKETGAVQWLANLLLGRPKTQRGAYARLAFPVGALSAFLNNTTVVAMLLPAIQDWSGRLRIPVSKMLIPLSYMAILGGTATLIGTSTNLVIDGLLQSERGVSLGMFDIAAIGVPLAVTGALFLILFAGKLLPTRHGALEQLQAARQYAVEFQVTEDGPVRNKTIAAAGLRSLNYCYLAEIQREQNLVSDVGPETVLHSGDRLTFIGDPRCAGELRKVRGLQPSAGDVGKLDVDHFQRRLVEVVIGPDFAGLGMAVRESRFRSRYKAVVLSISRAGQRLPGKIGDIELRVGDALLLEASLDFVEQYRFRRDFLLVSPINDESPANFRRAPWAVAILVLMVLLNALGLLEVIVAALVAAGLMLATGCVALGKLRRYIDIQVIIVISASFSLGVAMTKTGAASWLAHTLLSVGGGPWMALAAVFFLTVLCTELLTNNAAAVLVFPIAMEIADQIGADFMPFAVAVMIAASASFITPLGYQTNLMVMGPGGYRMQDFVRIGIPMTLLTASVALGLIPLFWPF